MPLASFIRGDSLEIFLRRSGVSFWRGKSLVVALNSFSTAPSPAHSIFIEDVLHFHGMSSSRVLMSRGILGEQPICTNI